MLKKASSTLWVITALPLLCLITIFVPALNPVVVSINGVNPNTAFMELLYNMDGLYPAVNDIPGAPFVTYYMPFGVVVFVAVLVANLIAFVLKAAGQEKGATKVANITSWCNLAAGIGFIVFYVIASSKLPECTIAFNAGAVVYAVVGLLCVLLTFKHRKQLDAEDTRAKYLKTIFTKSQKREAIIFYGMVGPFYLLACIVTLYPFMWGFIMSFTNYTGYNDAEGSGFSSYMRCLQDEQTWTSFVTTLEISIFYVPVGLVLGVALAMLLNTNIKGSGFFRTVYYFPSIIPAIATGLMWRMLFAQNNGAINVMLGWFGIEPFNWLGFTGCRYALYIMLAWGSAGGILTYLSALKGISNELYESAMIDGATAGKRFWSITLPMISSTLFYNLVTGLINAWQVYQQPVFLAGATMLTVPFQPNYTFVVQIYQQIFTNQRFGFGLAMVWVLFIASMITNRVVFWTGNFWVFNENEARNEVKKKKVKKQKAVVAGN